MAADFVAIIPARLASTRLPNKPLADIHGAPMVVRVAQQCLRSDARLVVVAADDEQIVRACAQHGVRALMTSRDHVSGTDRLAEAAALLQLGPEQIVVNVQGDEPLINPSLINAVGALLAQRPQCSISTAAHAIDDETEWVNPNVVKVVCDAAGDALYFSRAPIPWPREAQARQSPGFRPLRHLGIYAYRVNFLKAFPSLPPADIEQIEALEQLRALYQGAKIAVTVTEDRPGPGVDTDADLQRARASWAQVNC